MKDSHIQWTDHTFNPWEGCTKVSPGCLHCYAEARNKRFADGANWGKGAPRRRTVPSNWRGPMQWNAEAQRALEKEAEQLVVPVDCLIANPRTRVFCASLADWLDDEVPIEWLADLLVLIFDCGFLDWQLLTKRPQNFKERLAAAATVIMNHRDKTERNAAIWGWIYGWAMGKPPHNVWVGVSVEDQTRADERIPILLSIPARVRFLSCEPLLGKVKLAFKCHRDHNGDGNCDRHPNGCPSIHWVIVGGESGAGARVTDLGAVESLINQCRDAKVACFVKQLGARPDHDFVGYPGSHIERRLHLKHPKGGESAEWPERFRVAQFPEVKA